MTNNYLKNGEISEKSIHLTFLKFVETHPKLKKIRKFILHYPSEGKRSQRYGTLMKSLGMRKGVADLFIAVPRRNFGGLWMELKSAKGILSAEQLDFLADMRAQNFYACACWSIDESIRVISWYFGID